MKPTKIKRFGPAAQRVQILHGLDGQYPKVGRTARKMSKVRQMIVRKEGSVDEESGSDFEWEEQ